MKTCTLSERRMWGPLPLLASVVLAATQLFAAVPLGPLGVSLSAPGRLALDAAGNAYVTDPAAGQLLVLDAFGRVVATRGNLGRPLGIAVDSQGRIYLGDQVAGRVSVFDSQWTLLYNLGAGDGEFALPNHIAIARIDGKESVFVSDSLNNVVKDYQDGALVLSFGGFGQSKGQFDFPAGLCVSPNGELFVVDQNNDRIQVFDMSGGFLRAIPLQTTPGAGRSGRSQGIACDSSGKLYIADTFQGLIRVFDGRGAFVGTVGSYGENPGQLNLPVGVAVDSAAGRLLCASSGNSRIEVFGLDCFNYLSATPAVQSVTSGQTVTFTLTANCATGAVYQWYKGASPLSDSGRISGSSSSNLTLTAVTPADAGAYWVTMTNSGFVFSSPPATLNVVAAAPMPILAVEEVVTSESSPSPVSAVAEPPVLRAVQQADGDILLMWDNPAFVIESRSDFSGTWELVGGTSPYIIPREAVAENPAQYFRLTRGL